MLICPTGVRADFLSSPLSKNIPLGDLVDAALLIATVPPLRRGAARDRHGRWGGMRWTQQASGARRRAGRSACCVRQNRVVLTPRRWRQVGGDKPPATVARKPGHRGEHDISRKPIAQGVPGVPGVPVYSCAYYRLPLHTRTRVHRAPGTSLRPRSFEGKRFMHNSGAIAPREIFRCLKIESESLQTAFRMGCHSGNAPIGSD